MTSKVRSAGPVLLAAALSSAACRTDSSGLALRDPPSAGAGGEAGASAGAPAAVPGRDGGAGGSAQPAPDEGPGSIALLHGIVDGGRLFSCWFDGATGEALDAQPEPRAGLGFGERASLPLDWEVGTRSVRIELFTAPTKEAKGPSCVELLAGSVPPPFDAGPGDDPTDAAGQDVPGAALPRAPGGPRRAGSLLLAAGALAPSAHYALVAAGCATPAARLDPRACGSFDLASQSHLGVTLVELRRVVIDQPGQFGLQFLNASRSSASLELLVRGSAPGLPAVPIAGEVGFGSVRPRSGAALELPGAFELRLSGATSASYTASVDDVLAASGLQAIDLGRSYLAVYVGPALDVAGELALAAPDLATPLLVLLPRDLASP